MSQLIEKIEQLVTPALRKEKVELVDLTYQKNQGGWVLCFYLDKAGGITLEDCEYWSRHIGDVLDQSDAITHAYSLEVSSPGIRRPLKKISDFQKFLGKRVSIRLYAAQDGQKNFHGILKRADEESVSLECEGNKQVTLPTSQIAKSNLDPIIEV